MVYFTNREREHVGTLARTFTSDELFTLVCALEKAERFEKAIQAECYRKRQDAMAKAFEPQISEYGRLRTLIEQARMEQD